MTKKKNFKTPNFAASVLFRSEVSTPVNIFTFLVWNLVTVPALLRTILIQFYLLQLQWPHETAAMPPKASRYLRSENQYASLGVILDTPIFINCFELWWRMHNAVTLRFCQTQLAYIVVVGFLFRSFYSTVKKSTILVMLAVNRKWTWT